MDVFLIFFFIFGIASYLFWRMFRYIQNTHGKYAPDKVQRTYHTTKWAFFTHIDATLPVLLLPMAGLFIFMLFNIEWKLQLENVLFLILFLLGLFTFGYVSLYVLLLTPNHWKFTRDIFITSLPEEKAVHIAIRGEEFVIEDGDIIDVHYIANLNSKMQFGYSVYTLKDNRQFILTDRVRGSWILGHFFKKIPYRSTSTPFPIIK